MALHTRIDPLLADKIAHDIPTKDCALLLSGGVDSISVGFAAHRLGKKITAYSFQLKGKPTHDFSTAKNVAQIMGWNFVGIEISTKNPVRDFHRLVRFGCKKKTHFECSYPFLYVYPKIREQYVLSGWAADGYYGISRSAKQKYRSMHSKEGFNQFRDKYFKPHQCAGFQMHQVIADHWKKSCVAPYLSEPVRNFFYQFDWQELNKPYEKHHIRTAFHEFEKVGKIEKHGNLQIVAGIPEVFETLLTDKNINFKQRERMMYLYGDWTRKKGLKSTSTD